MTRAIDERPSPWPPTSGGHPVLTVVVPTRDESGNIRELVSRLETAVPELAAELVFVDDSADDTAGVIRALAGDACVEILLVRRDPGDRWGGLGGAVVDGMSRARARWVCVMDADLQHPPELIPDLLDRARGGFDLVVAARNQLGAGDRFSLRRLASVWSRLLAKFLFPIRLRDVSDPMTGFFLVRRSAVDLGALRPRGFKVLLDIIVRSDGIRIGEVSFDFGQRFAGESKASIREGLRYLGLLGALRISSLRRPAGSAQRFGPVAEETVLSASGD